MLSRRAKEAIKTGLAMTIAFGIALAMDWEKPYWSGFAVAMISLATVGQSLNKGAMRMLGTLVAAVVALGFLALFPQQRWLMMGALSAYLGLCTYMIAGNSRVYFWFVSAFVCVVIIVSSGPTSQSAFQIAIERTQETGLGILVYSLIAAFLWPQSSRADLEAAGRELIAVQHRLFRAYYDLVRGRGSAETTHAERMQEVRLAGQLAQALAAAETDSYSVWEVRHHWRRFRDDTTALGEALEHWRESFREVRELDVAKLLPTASAFCDELDKRFSAIAAIQAGEQPGHEPRDVPLEVDPDALSGLSHFQLAALTETRTQLARLEAFTRGLFETIRAIESSDVVTRAPRPAREAGGLVIDPDRVTAVLRVVATQWVAFLIWVYVDPPGHSAFVEQVIIYALVFVMLRQVSPTMMLLPFMLGTAFTGFLYVLVMPQLSGYTELGLMIFSVTAGIYYLFSEPRQALAKIGAIVPFVVLISVHNQQTYSFASYANSAAMIMLSIVLNIIMAYVPFSPRPEKVFLRLFGRFFRQVDFLLAQIAIDWEKTAGASGRLKATLYKNDLIELSRKLAAHAKQIDSRSFPDNPPEKVQALVDSIGAVAFRVKELLDARKAPQAEFAVRELLDDLRAWRLAIKEQIHLWVEDPEAAARQATDLQARLNQRLEKLEARIEKTFQKAGEGDLTAEDHEHLYRLLGSFRGLSEAGLNFVGIARGINWGQWREARF
ncbi:MAG: FUSC family protein [Kiloniellales bacterium]|nr:FUSC family protein [Kiloniellales bacterium]